MPHTHPFRFIDRVVARDGGTCTIVKAIAADERLRDGRTTPDRPCAASVVFEALAQAALPLLPDDGGRGVPGMIVAIDRARLHRPVWPGDRLLIAAAVVSRFGRLIKVRSEATLDAGESPPPLVAEGEFTLAAGGPGGERA